ncbi:hypothetical protein GQ42DRAFT_152034 [Ramicandelaber brevisporus]|nr:hypothetical protein GQ42DRAFT_152034 [Ramicandelaber brevisporus]
MVLFNVEVKARLDGVTDLQPAGARNYIWTVEVECSECPADVRKHFEVNVGGGAETTIECSVCSRNGSIAIVGTNSEKEFNDIVFDSKGFWVCHDEDAEVDVGILRFGFKSHRLKRIII